MGATKFAPVDTGNVEENMNHTPLHGLDEWKEAFFELADSTCFPELTARLRIVSPKDHEAAKRTRAIMERAFAEGWVEARPPEVRTGRTVAVVGGGMMGLAAAAVLNRSGHFVRVYESSPHLGGLLSAGRGEARVEQWVIDRRVRVLEAEGIEFVTGALIGQAIRFDELQEVSDALLLSIGHRRPRRLLVPGYAHPGVISADQLLRPRTPTIDIKGARVLILGDQEGSQQAEEYLQLAGAGKVVSMPLVGGELQKQLDRQSEGAWPLFHRHEGSLEPVAVVAIEGDAAHVEGVRCVRLHLDQDPSGCSVAVPEPGSAFTIPADLVVIASGYAGPDTQAIEVQLNVELDVHGNIAADRRFGTSVADVFYAGDANEGASPLLWDMSHGLEVAAIIDERLGGKDVALET